MPGGAPEDMTATTGEPVEIKLCFAKETASALRLSLARQTSNRTGIREVGHPVIETKQK